MRKAQWRSIFDRSTQPVHSDRADKAMKMATPSAHLVPGIRGADLLAGTLSRHAIRPCKYGRRSGFR